MQSPWTTVYIYHLLTFQLLVSYKAKDAASLSLAPHHSQVFHVHVGTRGITLQSA